jgi:methionine synthase II (cobalamin-independent)
VWMWERWIPVPFEPVEDGIVDRLARLGSAVPGGVELGFHICYGDYEHKHLQEPRDTKVCATIANAISSRIARPIQWIHLPVPIERDDAAYFAPLAGLKLHPETELYLGLVHFRDGVEGAERRIAAARQVVPEFGVGTECGMGRRPAERGGSKGTLETLLRTHAAVSESVR